MTGLNMLKISAIPTKYMLGFTRDQSIYDQQSLKDKSSWGFGEVEPPRYTYHVRIADLRALPEYSHEDFKIGDLVDV